MKKQKVNYCFIKYAGQALKAKREIPFEIKLTSRLLLDELCFNWNKEQLLTEINRSIDQGNKELFHELSEKFKCYVHEYD